MPVSAVCDKCGTKYRVDDKFAGKRVKCKKCDGTVAFPAAKPAGDDDDDIDIRLRDDEPDPVVPPPKPKMVAPQKIKAPAKKAPPTLPPARFEDDYGLEPPALPPLESLPTAPSIPSSSVRVNQTFSAPKPLGYATPRKAAVVQRTDIADQWGPLMIGSFFVLPFVQMVILGIFISVKKGAPPALWWGVQFGVCILMILIACGIIAPLIALGIKLAGKVMSFDPAAGLYGTALALLGWPSVVGTIVLLLIIAISNSSTALSYAQIVLSLAFATSVIGMVFMLRGFLNLSWIQTFVSAVFSFIIVLIGSFGTFFLLALILGGVISMTGLGKIMSGNIPARKTTASNSSNQWASPDGTGTDSFNSTSPPHRSTPEEIAAAKAAMADASLKSLLIRGKSSIRFAKTREKAQIELASLERELTKLHVDYPKNITQEQVDNTLAEFTSAVEQLPSTAIPADLTSAPESSEDWTLTADAATALGEPVQFRKWAISPGPLAKIDLSTSDEGDQGVSWNFPDNAKLTIRAIKATNADQQRPWVVSFDEEKSAAVSAKLQYIDRGQTSDSAAITTGKVGDTLFTRVARNGYQPSITYLGRYRTDWIEIVITGKPTGRTLASMENAARSIRPAKDKEFHNPFAPELVVARLGDDLKNATQLLTQLGAKAEPALLEGLKNSDVRVRRACAQMLGDLKTAAAVEPLLAIARNGEDGASGAAREAVKKISPSAFDGIEEAITDLKSARRGDMSKTLKTLAAAKYDESRRDNVSAVLEELLLNREVGHFDQDDLIAAIKVWHRDSTIDLILKPISVDDNSINRNRPLLLRAAAATGDKKAIRPISRWIIKESRAVTQALVSMGPTVEDEVIPLLRDRQARRAAVDILAEVGTKKSIIPLNTIANSRDAFFEQQPAKDAIQKIRAREEAEKKPK